MSTPVQPQSYYIIRLEVSIVGISPLCGGLCSVPVVLDLLPSFFLYPCEHGSTGMSVYSFIHHRGIFYFPLFVNGFVKAAHFR